MNKGVSLEGFLPRKERDDVHSVFPDAVIRKNIYTSITVDTYRNSKKGVFTNILLL